MSEVKIWEVLRTKKNLIPSFQVHYNYNNLNMVSMGSKGRRVILLILANLLLQNVSSSQWKVVTRGTFISSVKYSISEDALRLKKDEKFWFPVYDVCDSCIEGGYEPVKREKIEELTQIYAGKIYAWRRMFEKLLLCESDSSFIYQRLYLKGVKGYSIYVLSGNDSCWYKKDFEVTYQGYQVPTMNSLSEWSLVGKPGESRRSFLDSTKKQNTIKEFVFVVKTTARAFQFAVAGFSVCNEGIRSVVYHHPFFDAITGENSLDSITANSFYSYPGVPTILSPFLFYSLVGQGPVDFYLVTNPKEYDKTQLTVNVCKQIFTHYPFYEGRHIDEESVLGRFNAICHMKLDNKTFVDSLRIIIDSFHDPHFFIPHHEQSGQKRTWPGPVRLYEINHHVDVAAIFDTSLIRALGTEPGSAIKDMSGDCRELNRSLHLGDEVMRINGEGILNVVDSLSSIQSGNQSLSRARAISELLAEGTSQKPDTITVIRPESDTISFLIRYGKDFVIPPNFEPKQCDFRILKGNIDYFRINGFDLGVWIRFVNHMRQMRKAKGLIIDVRSNGGGEETSAIRLLSAFINRPSMWSQSYLPPDRNVRETMIVKPDSVSRLEIPVIILIDKKTACASEIFAYDMRELAGAILVGNSETAGEFAPRVGIVFPSGLKIFADCLFGELGPDNYDFEWTGLAPDIWVWETKVTDLAPYNDKVLETAIRLFKSGFLSERLHNASSDGRFSVP
jgi:C-terminal processing protease CtpA/Prc